jgi:single-strand DNA-binding protein
MQNLNRWQGIGRLGRDPESKATPSGQTVVNFSIACQDDYKDKSGEKVERTEWVRVVMWGKGAEVFSKYATKGSKVYIEGKLTTRKWQDKDGKDQYTTEVNATNFEFLGSKNDGGEPVQAKPQQAKTYTNTQGQPSVDYDDDIPF